MTLLRLLHASRLAIPRDLTDGEHLRLLVMGRIQRLEPDRAALDVLDHIPEPTCPFCHRPV